MPKEAFTARWVQSLKPTSERVELFDETLTGLVLRIEPSGRKSWRVAFRANKRWRRMNIGAGSLMDAQSRARDSRWRRERPGSR